MPSFYNTLSFFNKVSLCVIVTKSGFTPEIYKSIHKNFVWDIFCEAAEKHIQSYLTMRLSSST